ncbi:MAG TPA: hypothetical protein VKT77_22250 [Chthonomonadaceae bacterium]|nr:hypothetical protein [Chthonomonadaceae bacterium]
MALRNLAITLFIGSLAACLVLSSAAPAVAAGPTVALKATFFGPGATQSGLTVGDSVTLTATVAGSAFQSGWTLQIVETAPASHVLTSRAASTCTASFRMTVPGTATFKAILYRGAGLAPFQSAQVPVVWANRGPTQLVLTVLDRRETVNLTWDGAGWHIPAGGIFRQGRPIVPFIRGADTTAPVRIDTTVTVTAALNAPLPEGWSLWLGVRAPIGPATRNARLVRGPWPGIQGANLGRGWAAQEEAEVWICRGSTFTGGDPVALINIDWTSAGVKVPNP